MQNYGQKYIQMDQQQRQPRMVELETSLNILRVKQKLSYATGKYSTNYKAETMAMKNAAEELCRNSNKIKPNTVILTDALSVLQGLKNMKEKELDPLRRELMNLTTKTKVVLQWIPDTLWHSG